MDIGRKKILVTFGTRPEAIKMAPLVHRLRAMEHIDCEVCVTAQHRQMLDQVLGAFDIKPDYDLDLMRAGQTLTALTSRLLAGLETVFTDLKPSLALVQGDTTTTLAGALAAFYARVPVAHVEAGLRTFDLNSPFPEEMNRLVTGRLATLHFAATHWAAENLAREGVPADSIQVTGNTGIDAVLTIRDSLEAGKLTGFSALPRDRARKLIVVTAHRRESFGEGFLRICEAIGELASRPDVQIVGDGAPHRVKDEIDTFPSGKFGRWYEIGVTSDQHDLVRLPLIGHRRDIETDLHVGSFLADVIYKVGVRQRIECTLLFQKRTQHGNFQPPISCVLQSSKPQGDFSKTFKFIVELQPELGRVRPAEIDRFL